MRKITCFFAVTLAFWAAFFLFASRAAAQDAPASHPESSQASAATESTAEAEIPVTKIGPDGQPVPLTEEEKARYREAMKNAQEESADAPAEEGNFLTQEVKVRRFPIAIPVWGAILLAVGFVLWKIFGDD